MKKYFVAVLIALSALLGVLSFSQNTLGQALRIITPPQGGTGIGSATAGDVGDCLKVTDDSPFTYELGTCGSSSGGGNSKWATSTDNVNIQPNSGQGLNVNASSTFTGNLFSKGAFYASSTSLFTNGLLAYASSTLQNFTGVNATTTQATTTNFAVTGTATSTFAGGINLTGGCFAIGSVCVGGDQGGMLSTGVIHGGVGTVTGGLGASTNVDITAGEGFIYDNTTPSAPTKTRVSWGAQSAVAVANTGVQYTYWYVDSNGTINQTTTEPTRSTYRTRIWLFRTSITGGVITGISQNGAPIQQTAATLKDLDAALGPIKSSGLVPLASGANLKLKITAGEIYGFGTNIGTPLDPNIQSSDLFDTGVADTFRYSTQTGTIAVNVTDIDPANYQVGGVVTAIPGASTRVTIQYIFQFQSGLIRVVYGDTIYNSTADALVGLAGANPYASAPTAFTTTNSFVVGAIIATKGTTDLSATATFVPTDKFGLFSGALSSGTGAFALTNLSNVAGLSSGGVLITSPSGGVTSSSSPTVGWLTATTTTGRNLFMGTLQASSTSLFTSGLMAYASSTFQRFTGTFSTTTEATTTSLSVSGSSVFNTLRSTGLGTLANLLLNGSTTLQAFTATNSTTTNATTTGNASFNTLISTGLGTFANILATGSTTLQRFTGTFATTTQATTTSFAISNLTSALIMTGATGNTLEYAGTSCTNQFVRSLDAVGAATCATVGAADVSLANLTATDSTLTFSGTYNGSTARTIGLNLGNANTWTALQIFNGSASSTRLSAITHLKVGGTSTTTIVGDSGTSIFNSGVQVNSSTTLQAFTGTNATTTNATTTSLAISGRTYIGLNCTGNTNGGALTTDATGLVSCSDDDSGAGLTGSGVARTIAVWTSTTGLTATSGPLYSDAFVATTTTGNSIFNGIFQASSTALFGQGLTAFASSTLQRFTATFGTTTQATSTNFFVSTFGLGSDYLTDITGNQLTITAGALGVSEGSGSGLDADTIDSLDSLQFLRSDTTDNYTSGTLTFDSGTSLVLAAGSTLDINSTAVSIADTAIAFDGATTEFTMTGDFTINTDDLAINKSTGLVTLADGLLVKASTTLQRFTATQGTTTNATTTNYHVSNNLNVLGALTGNTLSLTGSSTLQNFTGVNSTTTNATTTNLSISNLLFFGGDRINDLVGTGLAVVGDALTTTLGTVVDLAAEVGSTILPIANGGTNKALTLSNGGLIWSDADSFEVLAANANAGLALVSGGAGTPSWFAPTLGSILFAGSNGALSQNNPSFFWDNTNGKLGVGTSTPWARLSVSGLSAGTAPIFAISTSTASATSTTFFVDQNGKVGLATTTPDHFLTINGSAYTQEKNVATSTTITVNLENSNQHQFTLGGTGLTVNLTNGRAGGTYRLLVCQDKGGSDTVTTWDSAILWSGGTAPTLTSTANKCDVVSLLATYATTTDLGATRKLQYFGATNQNF